jgi:cyclic beta-1,2-glucan synthetase
MGASPPDETEPAQPRRFDTADHATPRTHLLGYGDYVVMTTAAGAGYSRWCDIAVTRWREDPTCDPWGSFLFVRDVANGHVWSAGQQPLGRTPIRYAVEFHEHRVQISRTDGAVHTTTDIVVAPQENLEGRRISITNMGAEVREFDVTSYAEVVLATAGADSAHPAFSKLFVQTEFAADGESLLATRRHREPGEPPLWLFHRCTTEADAVGGLQFETDRAKFLGRGREVRTAAAVFDAEVLSGSTGTVLDPVLALRRRVRVAPGATARLVFWSGVAATRTAALGLADRHRAPGAFERIETAARSESQRQLGHLRLSPDDAGCYQRIANAVLYAEPALRAAPTLLSANQWGPAELWGHGISGDLPIVLLRVDAPGHLPIVEQLLRAQAYWRLKRLSVDLVILNECSSGASLELQNSIDAALRTAPAHELAPSNPGRGNAYALRGEALAPSSRSALMSAARAVFAAQAGPLSGQLNPGAAPQSVPQQGPPRPRVPADARPADALADTRSLEFFNGAGGFGAAGREYVTVLAGDQWTPAPWNNVIANPQFGFLASADGTGSTWAQNARENQLTPWSNDPISNAPAEVIYIRDEDSGELWSATPLPIRQATAIYRVHHGFGYTRIEHAAGGIALELAQFVPLADPVKLARLTLTNRSTEVRRLSVTHYLEWMLGNQRSRTAQFIITRIDAGTGALLARNPWSNGFQSSVAFMDMGGRQQSGSGDRAEFLGRHGSLADPAALQGAAPLTNRSGGGLDPCGALQSRVCLQPGERTEFILCVGEAESADAAVALIRRYRAANPDTVLQGIAEFWDRTLGAIQVKTPERSMDILLNGWLLYQTLACRLWGRTAFYQSSGAFGFRDQLQDVMALCVAQPALAREHILRAASRQFAAGDVQHWWLPVSGQGVKTRVSDDRIWLPFVLAHYLEVTEDFAVLDEPVSFLEGGPLRADQQEIFFAPPPAPAPASLYEHCARALGSSLAVGAHGLPLFGTGDWNDGMNRVGAQGRGESVWLGWFLHAALLKFAPLAQRRGDTAAASAWRDHADALRQAIEREAWDGDWYRRGYFDDGTVLGSAASDECRIDSIAQSWAVLSGAGDRERAARGMAAVEAQLVDRSAGLLKLFTPPFDRTVHDPGYIKAYPAGIRENGGQYTHAAMWSIWAFAALGDGTLAGELFELLNPINHATRQGIGRYRVEPYVVCADVYSVPPHVGRGGWTWYTGSAGWMYRTAVEGLLGVTQHGSVLRIDPCIPRAWPGFELTFTHGAARYHITVENPHGVSRGIVHATLDARPIGVAPCDIPLTEDRPRRDVRVTLGRA